MIAADSGCGALKAGTGGCRKVRYAGKSGRGKSGGARVVYFYRNEALPIFLFAVFGKGEKSNISKAEKNALRKLTAEIVKTYGLRK